MKFRCALTFTFLLFFSTSFFAQEKELDSLRAIIKAGKPDTSVAAAYVAYTEMVGYTEPDTVIPLSQKALTIINRHKTFQNIAEKRSFLKSKANALNNIGLIYMNQGDISQSLDYFHECLKIMEENKDKPGIVLCLNNIGGIYRGQGDNIQALDYYMRGLKMARAIKDKDGTAFSLGNIGVIYGNQGYYDRALDCYKKSLAIREEIGYKQGVGMSLNNIGYMYEKKNVDTAAIRYYEKSLEIWKEIEDKDGMAYTMVNMGTIYAKQGNYKKAEELGDLSFAISKEINYPEDIRDAAKLLLDVYKHQGQWKKAFDMQELFFTMKDSISNEETKKLAVKKQLQYQYDKEKLELEKEQEKKDVLREQEKQRQRIVTWSVAGVLILVLVFSFFLYNRFRLTTKQKKIIEEQKHTVEEKQKEIIDSIHYAQRIQSTLLANKELLDKHIPDHFVLFRPKDIVSGDFYWATHVNTTLYLGVCDSTGHGVPGAFMSLLNVSFLNEAIAEKQIREPHLILNHVRERLIASVSQDGAQDGMDGILVAINGKKVSYAAAYNAPVILRNGALIHLAADKMPIGKGVKEASFSLQTLEMQSGDVLYLYTDGYADQFGGPNGKKFKYKQLHEHLIAMKELPLNAQKDQLEAVFSDWKADMEQVDDVCIVGIRF